MRANAACGASRWRHNRTLNLTDKGLLIAVLQTGATSPREVDGAVVGAIGPGLLVLVCAERGDTEAEADKLLAKILKAASSATTRAR